MTDSSDALPEVELKYDTSNREVAMIVTNAGPREAALLVRTNAYRADGPWRLRISPGKHLIRRWAVDVSHNWYDFTVIGERFERRFGGRLETGKPGFSDPAV